jgi:ubiquitin C-terminal hydrolase
MNVNFGRECLNPEDNTWYQYNDDMVSAIHEPSVESSSPYVLFYVKA